MVSAVEAVMRLHERQRMAALAESGRLPVPRDVLSSDNTHQSPNYGAGDPFYSGPLQRGGTGGGEFVPPQAPRFMEDAHAAGAMVLGGEVYA